MEIYNNFYSIGQLSEICGIPKGTLRFYEKKGLLVPSKRNENNNYRYYSEQDVMDSIIIKDLQKKGMNITQMKAIIEHKDLLSMHDKLKGVIVSLEKERKLLEEKIEYAKSKHSSIKNCLELYSEIKESKQKFTIENREPSYVVFTKYKSKIKATKLFWNRFIELTNLSEKLNLEIKGPFSAIFHDAFYSQFYYEEGELEVFYPISKPEKEHDNIKYMKGFKEVSTIFIGRYQDLLPVYNELIQFIEGNNLIIIGPSFEEYLCDFSLSVDEKDSLTKISFPVKEKN